MIQTNKWIVAITLSILLVACTTANPAGQLKKQEQTDSPIVVREILKKTIAAMENIQSLSTTMEITQEVNKASEQPLIYHSTKSMDLTYKPEAIYQKMKVHAPKNKQEETELYMVDGGVYFKEKMEDEWFTYPEELLEDIIDIKDIQTNQVEQLELLQDYVEHLSLEETEEAYVITILGPVEDFQEFALTLHDRMNKTIATELDQVMSMVHIEQLAYEVEIDKETFLQTEMNMRMNLTLNDDGEKISLQTVAKTSLSQFNELDEIMIPPHIVHSAVELSLDLSDLEEMEKVNLDDETFSPHVEENKTK